MTITNAVAPIRVSNREEDSMNLEPSLSGKDIVGIIYPPPDIRSIVDKTANFVAKNGVEFENKIKEREALNPKFAFLSPNDPYHAYYKFKVKEVESNEINGIKAPPAPPSGQLPPQAPDAVRAHIREKEVVPEQPKGFEYMIDPSTINAYDLDVLRLTALFVARNGRQFLTQLMNREIRNFQFDFLKPQHSNFPYFTKLVEQYSMVILPPQNIDTELEKTSSFEQITTDVKNRVAWEKYQKAAKDRANEESEKERLAYAQIEWHDFVVVQTVDFQPSETSNLPPLCTPKDVGTRILMQQREEQRAASEAMEMEVESESDEGESSDNEEELQRDREGFAIPSAAKLRAQPRQPAPTADIPEDVIVRDYDPKKRPPAKAKLSDQYIISPLTNERIPANKLEEHVRYNTVDPQYKVQRDREMMDRIDEDPTNASGTEISRNISKLAERRTDIFGVGEKSVEQTAIGRKLGEEERNPNQVDPKPVWDNPQATTPQQEANIEALLKKHEQERANAAAAAPPAPPAPLGVGRLLNVPQAPPLMGLPPAFMPPPPGFMAMPGAPRLLAPPPHIQDTLNMPPAKKPRPDDGLVAEDLWLERVKGNINLILLLPIAAEWNVTGGQEHISLDVTSQVGQIKTYIQDKCGIPVGKQKLLFDNIFIKDNNSLAYYNMDNNSQVIVQLKERGGRKK
uniref:Splicing factor 3A subunit 1 n=1 Tax=Panagrellus redivivus TaxID=6233 RepID=A0A7E4ZVE5_PANRE